MSAWYLEIWDRWHFVTVYVSSAEATGSNHYQAVSTGRMQLDPDSQVGVIDRRGLDKRSAR